MTEQLQRTKGYREEKKEKKINSLIIASMTSIDLNFFMQQNYYKEQNNYKEKKKKPPNHRNPRRNSRRTHCEQPVNHLSFVHY